MEKVILLQVQAAALQTFPPPLYLLSLMTSSPFICEPLGVTDSGVFLPCSPLQGESYFSHDTEKTVPASGLSLKVMGFGVEGGGGDGSTSPFMSLLCHRCAPLSKRCLAWWTDASGLPLSAPCLRGLPIPSQGQSLSAKS